MEVKDKKTHYWFHRDKEIEYFNTDEKDFMCMVYDGEDIFFDKTKVKQNITGM